MRFFFNKVGSYSLLCTIFGLSMLSGCGGSGDNGGGVVEFTPGTSMVISIGPAVTVNPESVFLNEGTPLEPYFVEYPLTKDRFYTLIFVSGAGFTGQVMSNGNEWEPCVYSLRGDIQNRNYDLDISWGGISNTPQNISLKGVHYKYPDLSGTADSWVTHREIMMPIKDGSIVLVGDVEYAGVNATIAIGPDSH